MGNSKPTILRGLRLMPMNFHVSETHNLAQLGLFSEGQKEKKEYAPDKNLFLPALDYGWTSFQQKWGRD